MKRRGRVEEEEKERGGVGRDGGGEKGREERWSEQ